jgi:hypothetical protein
MIRLDHSADGGSDMPLRAFNQRKRVPISSLPRLTRRCRASWGRSEWTPRSAESHRFRAWFPNSVNATRVPSPALRLPSSAWPSVMAEGAYPAVSLFGIIAVIRPNVARTCLVAV